MKTIQVFDNEVWVKIHWIDCFASSNSKWRM